MTIEEIRKSKKIKSYMKAELIERRRRELERLKNRRSEGLCNAQLHHGPGHQSSTFCARRGKHTIHGCNYGCYELFMEWRKSEAFTGYFDEPKEL